MAEAKPIGENKAAFLACLNYCKTKGYPEPSKELQFAKDYGFRFRFDCYWPEQKLAIEFQGGGQQGRHCTFYGYNNDCIKQALAAALGWRCFSVTTHQVDKGMIFVLMDFFFGNKSVEELGNALEEIAVHYRRKSKKGKANALLPIKGGKRPGMGSGKK